MRAAGAATAHACAEQLTLRHLSAGSTPRRRQRFPPTAVAVHHLMRGVHQLALRRVRAGRLPRASLLNDRSTRR
jgi:hypothetical protein